jgi:hemoglobin
MAEREESSLYDRVGGERGIEHLVSAFYERVLSDPELAPFFENVPMPKLLTMQKEFFSEALGGPLFYSGRSLRDVHRGRGIQKEHLRRFTDHLLSTLTSSGEQLGLTEQEIDAIHSRIALEADEIGGGGAEAG